ncbi:hypothetical protein FHL15_003124 [Xylaria flabelliformis]|uniref:Uncharacterized protein n=1 Tax=Xylaria flabelliformis TaxID=2512241 RepID=A0A553I703_9PEZI|nr:hypothetical protein FHL15_003124 [Xylaria flabelliformis]
MYVPLEAYLLENALGSAIGSPDMCDRKPWRSIGRVARWDSNENNMELKACVAETANKDYSMYDSSLCIHRPAIRRIRGYGD